MRRNPPLPTATLATAKRLRDSATDAERELWYHLRAGRLQGLRFRRQHPLPPYVVDFYCHACRRSQHAPELDAPRTKALERKGLLVMRFRDNQVLAETDAVFEAILHAARNRTLSPAPLPEGEGLPIAR